MHISRMISGFFHEKNKKKTIEKEQEENSHFRPFHVMMKKPME